MRFDMKQPAKQSTVNEDMQACLDKVPKMVGAVLSKEAMTNNMVGVKQIRDWISIL